MSKLTDEWIDEIFAAQRTGEPMMFRRFARAIEAELSATPASQHPDEWLRAQAICDLPDVVEQVPTLPLADGMCALSYSREDREVTVVFHTVEQVVAFKEKLIDSKVYGSAAPPAPAQPQEPIKESVIEALTEMRKALQEIDHITQVFHEGGYGESGNRKAMREMTGFAQTWLKHDYVINAAALSSEQPQPSLEQPMDAWVDYAKRSGLLNADGIAPDPHKTQTAWNAFTAAWNLRAAVNSAQPVAPSPDIRKVAEAVREAAAQACSDNVTGDEDKQDLGVHDLACLECEETIRAIDIDALIEQVKGK